MERDYASNAKANTGVSLGGTALGVALVDLVSKHLFNQKPNIGMSDLMAAQLISQNSSCRQHSCCSDDEYVTRYEAKKDSDLAKKDSQIALLEAEINTNNKVSDVFERLSARIRVLENQVNENSCGQAVINQQFTDNLNFTNSQFKSVYKAIEDGDERVKCYVDCHFVPGKLVMPLGSICPPAMPACEPVAKK